MNGTRVRIYGGEHAVRTAPEKKKRHFPRLLCRFNGKLKSIERRGVEVLFGGVGYGLIEVMWRGKTHWTMVLAGGICFTAICGINKAMSEKKLILRAATCGAFITSAEFVIGLIVNKLLHLSVWSYSSMFGNILGQICPLYSMLWFLLSFPVCIIAGRMEK